MQHRSLLLSMFVLLLIVGCAAPAPTATLLPTDIPVPPTATSLPPTATATQVPSTATRVPPTVTRIPPTATQTPPTVTATPTPRPKGWITVKTMNAPSPRVGHAMTALSGGRVLLFGGRDKAGKVLGDTWILGPATKSYSPRYNLGLVFSANLVGGLILESQQFLQAGTTDWTKLNPAHAPAARADSRVFTGKDGQAYLIGGDDEDGGGLMDLHIFDPKSLDWKSLTFANTPPAGRSSQLTWEYNNSLYIQGGVAKKDGKTILYNDMWRYDYASKLWEQLTSPPGFITTSASPIVVDSKAYLLDAHSFPFNKGTTQVYDMANRVWEQFKIEGDLPPGQRSGYSTVQVDKTTVMLGGALYDASTQKFTYTQEVWSLDLPTGKWKRLGDMPFPISQCGSVVDLENHQIIVWGGQRAVNEFTEGVVTLFEDISDFMRDVVGP